VTKGCVVFLLLTKTLIFAPFGGTPKAISHIFCAKIHYCSSLIFRVLSKLVWV